MFFDIHVFAIDYLSEDKVSSSLILVLHLVYLYFHYQLCFLASIWVSFYIIDSPIP